MLHEDTLLKDLKAQEEELEKSDKREDQEDSVRENDANEEIYIPQAEYSAVCNADFLPMICNDFITDFLDQEHGAC
jgi:hypothetical protein